MHLLLFDSLCNGAHIPLTASDRATDKPTQQSERTPVTQPTHPIPTRPAPPRLAPPRRADALAAQVMNDHAGVWDPVENFPIAKLFMEEEFHCQDGTYSASIAADAAVA